MMLRNREGRDAEDVARGEYGRVASGAGATSGPRDFAAGWHEPRGWFPSLIG